MRARRPRPRLRGGREPRRHRRLGLRQIGAGQMHSRADGARRRLDPDRRRGDRAPAAPSPRALDAQIRHAVPGRRLVQFAARVGECRVRPDPGPRHGAARGKAGRAREAGRRRARAGGRRAAAGRAFRRHAEARCAGARDRRRAGDHLLRRAHDRARSDHGRRDQRAHRQMRARSGRHRGLDHP